MRYGLVYYRLHGSPEVDDSAYPADHLDALAESVSKAAVATPARCISGYTAIGVATADAPAVAVDLGAGGPMGGAQGNRPAYSSRNQLRAHHRSLVVIVCEIAPDEAEPVENPGRG